jgi:hypothetical protein
VSDLTPSRGNAFYDEHTVRRNLVPFGRSVGVPIPTLIAAGAAI